MTQPEVLERRFIERALNEGDLAVVDEVLAEDYLGHTSTSPDPLRGREGMKAYIQAVRRAFPDLELRLQHVVVGGNQVASHWIASGTHDGEFQGLEPTGNTYEAPGMEISRIEDDQIAEQWHVGDQLGMLQQLGVIPNVPAEKD